jgi:hypothetical protein
MKVRVTKAFRWAREGIHVVDIHVDDVVDGRAAEIALAEGWGREVEAESAAPRAAALPAAPENKAEAAGAPQQRRRR